MYKVTLVFEDSSTISELVVANCEESALNALINNTKIVKQPKFVLFEKPTIFAKEDDLTLVSDFESSELSCGEIYTFKNKLCETINVGGINVSLGHLEGFIKILGETK